MHHFLVSAWAPAENYAGLHVRLAAEPRHGSQCRAICALTEHRLRLLAQARDQAARRKFRAVMRHGIWGAKLGES